MQYEFSKTNSCRNRNRAIYSIYIPRSNGVSKTIYLALSAKQCLVQDLFVLKSRNETQLLRDAGSTPEL